jgi:hypothetical protein
MSTTPSTDTELDPLVSVSDSDHGGYIVFATFASLLVALAFWTVRLTVRWRKRFWAGDDVMLVLAMVCRAFGNAFGGRSDADYPVGSRYPAECLCANGSPSRSWKARGRCGNPA